MKKSILKFLTLGLITIFSLGIFVPATHAEDTPTLGASITLQPVSKTMEIQSDAIYDSSFQITNDGDAAIRIEVYAAPYSYVYSESDDTYKLGFSNENNFTQLSRWITIQDTSGNFVERTTFSIEPKQTIDIIYRISTPNNIPAGGQYAVIFSQTISDAVSSTGIRTEASAGMIIYGHSSEGEVITSAEISDLKIEQNFSASAKVKNTGNTDFSAFGTLKVEPIIGFSSYETPSTNARISVIPESEREITDKWEEGTPSFGIYKATWTIVAGETTETIERIVFLISPVFIIITITLLTIIVIWIIIRVRKRKERRSRLAV
ncbi:hypothetical protein IKF57_02560 [Candidatus Saccharibacteria bacterium]|nr:hypothetical protein [Candidatus Saccharibacteria bacterium]